MRKKFYVHALWAVALSFLLAFGMGASSAMAQEVSIPTAHPAVAGSKVVIPINITDVTGVGGYGLRLDYDETVLTNPQAVATGTFSEAYTVDEGPVTSGDGKYIIAVAFGMTETGGDKPLVSVQFDVAADFIDLTASSDVTFAGPNQTPGSFLQTAALQPITAMWTNGSVAPPQPNPTVTTTLLDANGTVTVDGVDATGEKTYTAGDEPVYTITPIDSNVYKIGTFEVDGVDSMARLENDNTTYGFQPLAEGATHTISVGFVEIDRPTVDVSVTGEGKLLFDDAEITGLQTYNVGDTPMYMPTATTGYKIESFQVNGEDAPLEDGAYTFATLIESDEYTVAVVFSEIIYPKITATKGDNGNISTDIGTDTGNPGEKSFGLGSMPMYTVAPATGYKVDTFTVTLNSTPDATAALTAENTYTFNTLAEGDVHAINVTFVEDEYTVTPSVTDGVGGTITPAEATAYTAGTDVEITVAPADCYEVDTLMVGGEAVTVADNKYTISSIGGDTDAVVTFKKMQYTVTPSAGDNGTITPAAAADYDCGSDVAITVAPAAGYVVDTFMVGGQEVTLTANAYTIPAIMADTGVAVTFKLDNQVPVAPTEPIAATIYLGDDKIMGTLTATDPDGDDIASYAVAAQGTMGQVIVVGDAFTYYLTATTVGADTFTFTATDSKGGVSEPIEVTVNVEEQNDAPVCVDQAQVVAAGGVLKGNLVATDTEDTIASYALVTNVAEGDLIVKADGSFTYIAADDAIGQVTFTFMATDSRGKASDVDGVVTISFGDTFTVTASVAGMTEGGTLDPVGEQTVAEGGDVTFAVTINEDYRAAVTDNGVAVELDANDTYTISNVAEDHTIVVTFSEMGEYHSADCGAGHSEDAKDYEISMSELLRVIQLYTQSQGAYHCDATTEDGYASGEGDQTCDAHDSDYNTQNWKIELTELLRVIQFYTLGGYHLSPGSEDDFAAGKE